MHGIRLFASFLAIAGCVALGLAIAQRPASAQAQSAQPSPLNAYRTMRDGVSLYERICAACHDHATGRTPTKEQLQAKSPEAIMAALTTGIMRAQGEMLSPVEKLAIIQHLTGRTPSPAPQKAETTPCPAPAKPLDAKGPQWNGWGRGLDNARFQPDPGLSAADVPRLKVKWSFAYPGSRYGQPTMVGGRLFVASTAGVVYALDAKTGCSYWSQTVDAGARTTISVGAGAKGKPAVFLGDLRAVAYGLDADTGAILWKTQIDDHPRATLTGSPVYHDGRLYYGISSLEEVAAAEAKYPCCTFRGSVVALDAATGRIIWKSYVITEPLKPVGKNKAGVTTYGPAGGAVWSSPAIDVKRKLVYVGAGNGYIPADTNGTDAVIAMDMKTGAIRWTRQFTHYDPYVVGCEFGGGHDNCPTPLGPDADVSGGVIIRTLSNGHDILLAGTKGGEYAALDPDNKGAFVWRIRVGAGSALGGVHWGAAADADKAYVAVSDVAVRGEAAHPSLQALDLATGKVVWDTATPKVACAWGPQPCGRGQSQAVSAMEGAIFSGALDGRLRAYAAGDGKIIWDFDTGLAPYNGGSLDAGGPTIAEGMVFVHSGYPGLGGFGRQQNVLLAFSVDGK